MDDGFLLRPSNVNFDNFCFCVNNLHPSITFTFEHIISQALYDAALQSSAPYKDKKNTLHFLTTYNSNVNNKRFVTNIHKKIYN